MIHYNTQIKRMQALGCAVLAAAILGGAMIAGAPKTAQAVEAKTVRASESGYCVVPAWCSANDDQIKLSTSEAEEFEIEPQIEELVQVNFRVDMPLIKGCVPVPNAVQEAQEAQKAYTEEELELLACVIYCEAGGDEASDETRRMVGEVVLNRVADPRFPSSILGVLTQRGQYGLFWKTGVVWPGRASREPEAVERAYACARLVLEGERLLPEDVIFQAEFIQGEIVASAPGFYFCR